MLSLFRIPFEILFSGRVSLQFFLPFCFQTFLSESLLRWTIPTTTLSATCRPITTLTSLSPPAWRHERTSRIAILTGLSPGLLHTIHHLVHWRQSIQHLHLSPVLQACPNETPRKSGTI